MWNACDCVSQRETGYMPTSLASILPRPTSATLQTPVSVSRMLGLCRGKECSGCWPDLLQRE